MFDEELLYFIMFFKDKVWLVFIGYWSIILINLYLGDVVGSWYFSGKDFGVIVLLIFLFYYGDSVLVGMIDGIVLLLNFDNGIVL